MRSTSGRINWPAELAFFFGFVAGPAVLVGLETRVGIVALFGFLVAPVLALILGLIGRRRSRRSGGLLGGERLADWGIGLSLFGLFLGCIAPAASGHARPAAQRAQMINNYKMVALALHNYANQHGRFPPQAVRAADGRPLYSWRVLILPYMEAQGLHDRFHLDEPWDSPHNRALIAEMPSTFRPFTDAPPGTTFLQAAIGPGTVWDDPAGLPYGEDGLVAAVPDGTDQTLVTVEAAHPVPWTAPMDVVVTPGLPLLPLGGSLPGHEDWLGRPKGTPGFVAGFVDGSVHYIKNSTQERTIRALTTRAGGEVVGRDAY